MSIDWPLRELGGNKDSIFQCLRSFLHFKCIPDYVMKPEQYLKSLIVPLVMYQKCLVLLLVLYKLMNKSVRRSKDISLRVEVLLDVVAFLIEYCNR